MTRMTLQRAFVTVRPALLVLAVLGTSSCAQWARLTARAHKAPVVEPVAAPAPAQEPAPVAVVPARSLAQIVNQPLQHGKYAEGQRELRQYLDQHPDDHAAQELLRQLTADPERWLGPPAGHHVVGPGDSYSTLARRYLGDAGLFLILARYNGATNPSVLRIGQIVRYPALPHGEVAAHAATEAAARHTAPVAESVQARAQRLQRESVTLLGEGRKTQALERLDQALDLDPRLPPVGNGAAALRQQLLGAYHQRAIVLYRDQQLDPAIALWDRVLAIDPGYEAAVIYRARAMELKRRLKQY